MLILNEIGLSVEDLLNPKDYHDTPILAATDQTTRNLCKCFAIFSNTSFFVALPPNICLWSAHVVISNRTSESSHLSRLWLERISWVLRLVTWGGCTWNVYCERRITPKDLYNLICKILHGKHSEHSIQRIPGQNLMFSSISTTYHCHTSHNCHSLTSEDRLQGHGTQGIRINYSQSRGLKKNPPFLRYRRYGREESPAWKAWNWWNLVKLTLKRNTHFPSESFQRENTGLPVQTFCLFRKFSSGTYQKSVFHLHPNRNLRNLLVNGKRQEPWKRQISHNKGNGVIFSRKVFVNIKLTFRRRFGRACWAETLTPNTCSRDLPSNTSLCPLKHRKPHFRALQFHIFRESMPQDILDSADFGTCLFDVPFIEFYLILNPP